MRAPLAKAVWASVLALSVAACDQIVQACIDLDGPEFTTPGLPSAVLGKPYAATIEVEIVREPYDDSFDYEFDTRGSLPPGLEVRQAGFERRIVIVGTPTATGSYDFEVRVFVRDPYYYAGSDEAPTLCWLDAQKTYRIVVDTEPATTPDTRSR